MDAAQTLKFDLLLQAQGSEVSNLVSTIEVTPTESSPISEPRPSGATPEAKLVHIVPVAALGAGLRNAADALEVKFWPHRLDVTIGDQGDISWRISCSATEGADCRKWCAEQCEEWTEAHDSHEMVDQGHCIKAEGWFDDTSLIQEFYCGEIAPLRPGPVVLEWEGEGYAWRYPNKNDE